MAVCGRKFYNRLGIELCSTREDYVCENAAGDHEEFA
jgi:hypothetical protein